VAEGEGTVAAGWFADPGGTGVLRYWDGADWTPYISVPIGAVSPATALERERAITTWVQRAWLVWPVLVVVGAFVGALTFDDLIDDLVDGRTPGNRYLALQPVGYLLLGLTVVIVVWAYRGAVAGRALGIHARREPGLVVVGWIVPVISLWWPYESAADLVPDRAELQPALGWWWAGYIGQSVLILVVQATSAATSWRIAAIGLVPVAVLATVAAVCGRRIARDVLAIHEREITARWLDREV